MPLRAGGRTIGALVATPVVPVVFFALVVFGWRAAIVAAVLNMLAAEGAAVLFGQPRRDVNARQA